MPRRLTWFCHEPLLSVCGTAFRRKEAIPANAGTTNSNHYTSLTKPVESPKRSKSVTPMR